MSDSALRPTCLRALNSLTPMLSLVNHGCEKKLRALGEAMQAQVVGDDSKDYAQQAHDISGELAPAAAEVRDCLRSVCLRVLTIADASLAESLHERRLDLRGRLCLREYPKLADAPPQQSPAAESAPAPAPARAAAAEAAPRLGAHCDSTLMTLLWADAPGLQVLEPERAAALGWRPQHVLGLGLPMMIPLADAEDGEASSAEPPPLTDAQWAHVEHDWARDPLLLTVGASWLSSDLMRERCPARCAALHRVALPPGVQQRHSLPFLADLVPAEDETEQP